MSLLVTRLEDWLAPHLPPVTPTAWRVLRYLTLARVLVVAALALYPLAVDPVLLFDSPESAQAHQVAVWVYLGFAGVCAWLARCDLRIFHLQVVVQTLLELVLVAMLLLVSGRSPMGMGALLILPTLAAAIFSTQTLTLFLAALGTLVLFTEVFVHLLRTGGQLAELLAQGRLLTTGFTSALFFVIGILVNLLARRLQAEEALAARRGEALSQQVWLNQWVVAEMNQGVALVEPNGAVQLLNRKAQALMEQPPAVAPDEGSPRIAQLRALARQGGGQLDPAAGETSGIRVRSLSPPEGHLAPGSEFGRRGVVLLLEDMAELEGRAQQLKLASMGRLSASIAHEIRNPLGAIRHAGALLAERIGTCVPARVEAHAPAVAGGPLPAAGGQDKGRDEDVHAEGLLRLTRIIESSTLRINRVVEDVLLVARPNAQRAPLDMQALLQEFCRDHGLRHPEEAARLQVHTQPGPIWWFDPDHLHRILVNLVSNAVRHGSGAAGSVRLEWPRQGALWVCDDGPGVTPGGRTHLFEPFYSTDPRGHGLGLFLARELALANDADLHYRWQPDEPHGSAFVLEFRVREAET